jgi:hypothetical protein
LEHRRVINFGFQRRRRRRRTRRRRRRIRRGRRRLFFVLGADCYVSVIKLVMSSKVERNGGGST